MCGSWNNRSWLLAAQTLRTNQLCVSIDFITAHHLPRLANYIDTCSKGGYKPRAPPHTHTCKIYKIYVPMATIMIQFLFPLRFPLYIMLTNHIQTIMFHIMLWCIVISPHFLFIYFLLAPVKYANWYLQTGSSLGRWQTVVIWLTRWCVLSGTFFRNTILHTQVGFWIALHQVLEPFCWDSGPC